MEAVDNQLKVTKITRLAGYPGPTPVKVVDGDYEYIGFRCKKCKIPKALTEFTLDAKDNRNKTCKECKG